MKICFNKDINKNHKKLPMTSREPGRPEDTAPTMDKPIKPIKDPLAAQQDQTNNQRALTEKHNDEKLTITILIVRSVLVAYHF